MIVLDTNVLAEMMRGAPDPAVLAWTDAAGPLGTTAVTLAEIEYGVTRLPDGRRRRQLAAAAAEVFADFEGVLLPFDVAAARQYARIVLGRERRGLPIASADAQIAAICAARDTPLATRNTADFEHTGITLIDPWQS